MIPINPNLITIYYKSMACRRCRTLKQMLKSNNIKFNFTQERKVIPNLYYPVVRTPSGKTFDYMQMHSIILNKRWDDLK